MNKTPSVIAISPCGCLECKHSDLILVDDKGKIIAEWRGETPAIKEVRGMLKV